MTRTLEVITIGKTPLFSRANVPSAAEQNEIIALQHSVSDMVKEVKAYKGNKREFANAEVKKLVFIHSTYLGSRFSNLEQAIRELARAKW